MELLFDLIKEVLTSQVLHDLIYWCFRLANWLLLSWDLLVFFFVQYDWLLVSVKCYKIWVLWLFLSLLTLYSKIVFENELKMHFRQLCNGRFAKWAIAHPGFGGIEGTTRQRRRATLLFTHPSLSSYWCHYQFDSSKGLGSK